MRPSGMARVEARGGGPRLCSEDGRVGSGSTAVVAGVVVRIVELRRGRVLGGGGLDACVVSFVDLF